MLLLTFFGKCRNFGRQYRGLASFPGLTSGPFIAISIRVENGREDVRVLKKIRLETTIMLIGRE
jgi:hypothetical protein